jgi:hypothetical protein
MVYASHVGSQLPAGRRGCGGKEAWLIARAAIEAATGAPGGEAGRTVKKRVVGGKRPLPPRRGLSRGPFQAMMAQPTPTTRQRTAAKDSAGVWFLSSASTRARSTTKKQKSMATVVTRETALGHFRFLYLWQRVRLIFIYAAATIIFVSVPRLYHARCMSTRFLNFFLRSAAAPSAPPSP